MSGYTKTFLLMAALTALFMLGGLALGGQGGMMIALLMAAGMNLFAYWNSDTLALKAHRAKPLDAAQLPWLDEMIAELAAKAGMPKPKSYVIDTPQPNAFATGRNPQKGAVAVTTGLLKQLDQRELRGVIAHELAHIQNRDTLIMTVTATMAGALSMLANFAMFFGNGRDRNPVVMILLMILAPLAASLVQMAISRSREFEADRIGADISGDPEGLALALEKIEGIAARTDFDAAEDHPASAHLFIINPLHAHAVDGLFRTHPKTALRIARLREMTGRAPQPATAQSGTMRKGTFRF